MDTIVNFNSVGEYLAYNHNKMLHPMVAVVHLEQAAPRQFRRMRYAFYTIFLKKVKCGDLRYGLSNYDYEEGTLVFLAPGQVIGQYEETFYQPQGTALVFHPDFLVGTSLGKAMHAYHFFSYAVTEALHISEEERATVLACFDRIEYELHHVADSHSKQLILSNIELFLNYCSRFYDRQFTTREHSNRGILARFEAHLGRYFFSDMPRHHGLPSVAGCAEEFHLSANYFGDLVKKETGTSPQEYIQAKVIEVAKMRLSDPGKTISEIAYELGFKYPQHFTRLFKQRTGLSPNRFRMLHD